MTLRTDEVGEVLTVAALNRKVRAAAEQTCNGVWLEAEVSQAKVWGPGHIYFSLCDPGGKAQVPAVMWRTNAVRWGSLIREGTRILALGTATVYEVNGRYQFIAEKVLAAGAGDRARALAELTEKLRAEGLLAPERRRPLPRWPSCVGIVTSRQGAALRDIIKVTSRRFPVRLLLCHTAVQGAEAPADIERAIGTMGSRSDVDVVIVGRGGGGIDDLEAFNDERVVRAVAACPVPVISAVGHEVDTTLTDLVADRRAATPSEAAELAVPDGTAVAGQLNALRRRMEDGAHLRMAAERARHAALQGRMVARDPRTRLRAQMNRFSACREFLRGWPDHALGGRRMALMNASHGVYRWPEPALARARGHLGQLGAGLQALSPLANLSRGWAIVSRGGVVLKRADDVKAGESIRVRLAEGMIDAAVTGVVGTDGGTK